MQYLYKPLYSRETTSCSRLFIVSFLFFEKKNCSRKMFLFKFCLMFRVALNVSPKGKLVRRLSVLKSAIERFAIRKKLIHSSSFSEGERPPRSLNAHDDFSFRIISPKLKEKIRQQAFSQSINTQEQQEGKFRCYVINKTVFKFTMLLCMHTHTYPLQFPLLSFSLSLGQPFELPLLLFSHDTSFAI